MLKRTASSVPKLTTEVKRPRPQVPDYHLTPSLRDESGDIIWPAPRNQIENARDFIRECVAAKKNTLIVPDKDADGLSSGAILQNTLILLGLDPDLISVHLLQKGCNPHDESERQAMSAYDPAYIFILDQGSRKSPPVINEPHRALIIDHHWATDDDFPQGAEYVTSCNSPPVAACALLTYQICVGLHESVVNTCDWLCVIGTHGDLGTSLKWNPPFPDMTSTFKTYTKRAINESVSLINAPRRTAAFNVAEAWEALSTATTPDDLLQNSTLRQAKVEVNAEVERCTHTAPRFSSDGKIATFRIHSAAQVHPIIAMRWAGHLQTSELEAILVANEGYLPGQVSFSCRIPRSVRGRDPPVNLIDLLRGVAERAPDPTLREKLGQSFARGHKEASGGIMPTAVFEEFMDLLEIDKGPRRTNPRRTRTFSGERQSNTLMNYFEKKPAIE
ncbi:DHH family protein [Xylaria nigripes]|nr:DHH family protein [Xylaria nigripes]